MQNLGTIDVELKAYNNEFVPAAGALLVLVLAFPKRFNGAGLFVDEANMLPRVAI